VLVSSSRRWALVHELRGAAEPGFAELLECLSPCDLVLIEGFKRERVPKLEVYRTATGEPLLHPQDRDIVAIASDQRVDTRLPQFDLDDAPSIASFVLKHVGLA
jgi:molybdopterin-guanine dinucleotide biosynthesis protein B